MIEYLILRAPRHAWKGLGPGRLAPPAQVARTFVPPVTQFETACGRGAIPSSGGWRVSPVGIRLPSATGSKPCGNKVFRLQDNTELITSGQQFVYVARTDEAEEKR